MNKILRQTIKTGVVAAILICCGVSHVEAQTQPWIAPGEAASVSNPVVANAAGITEAKTIYTRICAQCHGYTGKGDGPVAPLLNPRPADHTSALIQNETDGALFWKISTGRGAMPSFKGALTDVQKWNLVHYIRTLKR